MRLPHLDDAERRRRIAVRHAVAPEHRLPATDGVVGAVRAVGALHSTEPHSVHLAAHARVRDLVVEDVERALHRDRTVVKQLAMRRTLWTVEPSQLPALLGSSSARVAGTERARVVKDAVLHGLTDDGERWFEQATGAVLDRLSDGSELSAVQLREQVPELAGTFTVGAEKKYGGTFNIAPRVLTALAATGVIVRGGNGGHWRTSRPRWTSTTTWLGELPEPLPEAEGWAELVRCWLARFGPGTEADIVWWLGATKGIVRGALAHVGAEQVSLDGGGTGWVLPGDTDPTDDPGPWAALLPVLDPTLMGWRERAFYLPAEHVPYLFDSNGNGGTTAWWNGRVVGCWVQDEAARVEVLLRDGEADRIGRQGLDALALEAERVTAFLAGTVISSVYKSALMKGVPLP